MFKMVHFEIKDGDDIYEMRYWLKAKLWKLQKQWPVRVSITIQKHENEDDEGSDLCTS